MGRLTSIEALRGLAALAVTWFHLTNTYASGDAVRLSGSLGWLGVDCFFVISGFVIPYALHHARYETTSFWRFLARRLVRLEPPYVASIILVIALAYASSAAPGFTGNPPNYSLPQLASHLIYLIPATSYHWVSPIYWSLAYEFVFYIGMGLMFVALWKRPLLVTAGLSLAVFAAGFAITGAWDARLMLFLFGIAGVRLFVGRDSIRTFLICVAANAALIGMTGAPLSATIGLGTALVLAFVKIPAWPPIMWLGAISYSLYLTHVPVGGRIVNLGRRFIEGEAQELALSFAALAGSLLFAWGFYWAVETAATRLSKRVSLAAPAKQPALGEAA